MTAAAERGDLDVFTAERPWGSFQQFVENEPVTVKIIIERIEDDYRRDPGPATT